MKGYLTVFLTLILTIILSLCLTLVWGARENTRLLQAECAADIGMNSILAEYHRELLYQYELFFVDTAYGSGTADYRATEEHLRGYLEKNVKDEDLLIPFLFGDLNGLSVESVEIIGVSAAADDAGAVLRRQIAELMQEKIGLAYFEQLLNWVQEVEQYDLTTRDVLGAQKDAAKRLEEWSNNTGEEKGSNWNAEYLLTGAAALWQNGILDFVVEDTADLSDAEIPLSERLANRELLRGTGMNPTAAFEDGAFEQLLFNEYILQYTGNYLKAKEGSCLQYQTEYILCGLGSDRANLRGTAERLWAIRAAANYVSYLSDEKKKAAVNAAASVLATLTTQPETEQAFALLISLTWVLMEGLYDVKQLFSGNRVPLNKTSEEWHYSIEQLFGIGTEVEAEKGRGLSYQDYVRILLLMQDKRISTLRLMDMMETDIRQTPGNEHFRIDGCVDGIIAEIAFSSQDGRLYKLTRSYCY